MSIPAIVQTALDNLVAYNNGDYDAATNPKGMSAGGHRINFDPALSDVVTVANWWEATRLVPSGAYVLASAFDAGSVATRNGSAWLATVDVPANEPPPDLPATSNDFWTLLVAKGDAGAVGFDWKGAWVLAANFIVRDGVARDGRTYIATVAHTAAADTEPGVGANWATVWDLMVEKGADGLDGLDGTGTGDMLVATYDPGGVGDNAFDMAKMAETADAKVMTAAERTKLDNIDANATADQTGAQIKAAYEALTNTNVFTDAEKTKLADLGGGSGGVADFVASGALPTGDFVVLNSDGTVSVVAETFVSQAMGTPVVFESATALYVCCAYDPVNDVVVVGYADSGNNGYGTAAVGTITGTTISFGTPVVWQSISCEYVEAAYDESAGKVVFFYLASFSNSNLVAGTVSGTSILFGTPVSAGIGNNNSLGVTYDSVNEKVVVFWRDSQNTGRGSAKVASLTGDVVSFGALATFETGGVLYIDPTFDVGAGKVLVAYQDAHDSARGKCAVGSVSGTTISFSPPVQFSASGTIRIRAAYSASAGASVIAFNDTGAANYGKAIVATISGSTVSYGTIITFASYAASYIGLASVGSSKVVISVQDASDSLKGKSYVGTIDGVTISFEPPVEFEPGSALYIDCVGIESQGKAFTAYHDSDNSNYGTGVVFQVAYSATTADDWIGAASAAVADTATGGVTIKGGINDQQNGLATKSVYYLADDGNLTTTPNARKVGRALSATKIYIEH